MRQDAKKILKIALVSALFLFIVAFAFFNSRDLIFGVQIKNVRLGDTPPVLAGMKVTDSIQKVTGMAKNAVKLVLNGREISIDQSGNWSETIILSPGYNIVNILAQDKFGNKDEKNYKIIYEAEENPAQ